MATGRWYLCGGHYGRRLGLNLALKVVTSLMIKYLLKNLWHCLELFINFLLWQGLPSFIPTGHQFFTTVNMEISILKIFPTPIPGLFNEIQIWTVERPILEPYNSPFAKFLTRELCYIITCFILHHTYRITLIKQILTEFQQALIPFQDFLPISIDIHFTSFLAIFSLFSNLFQIRLELRLRARLLPSSLILFILIKPYLRGKCERLKSLSSIILNNKSLFGHILLVLSLVPKKNQLSFAVDFALTSLPFLIDCAFTMSDLSRNLTHSFIILLIDPSY